jgi:6-phosphogluconolactonase
MILQGTSEQLAEKAAALLAQGIRRCLAEKTEAVLAVPGGRSVAAVLAGLRRQEVSWGQLHIFLLDERLVPTDHADSNFRLVKEQLETINQPEMLHPFRYHPENPHKGVAEYKEELQRHGGRFDIVLASSGEDGHIASLFPRHPSISNPADTFILVNDAPKPPPMRMSASRALIGRADTGVVLFLGSAKAGALRNALDGKIPVDDCPAKIVMDLHHYALLTDQEVVWP